jgi:mannosyl-3-phosphoglycerate phosphatase
VKQQPRLVVITDVDGCLVIDSLKQHGIPVVLCSSKTRAELERLQQELGLSDPFISENGGALYSPIGTFPFALRGAVRRGGYEVVELGRPHREVVGTLVQTAARLGMAISTFGGMSVERVAEECGLSLAQARLAKLREYDEPFRLAEPDDARLARLSKALRAAGLRFSTGGRYRHVTGGTDKGVAMAILRRFYERASGDVVFAGLGDNMNDVELLRAVDVAIVVRSPVAGHTAAVLSHVRGARVTAGEGPDGWSEAVAGILDGNQAVAATGHVERCG